MRCSLDAGLFSGEGADDRNHEALAVQCLDYAHDPKSEKTQAEKEVKDRYQKRREEHGNHRDDHHRNPKDYPRNKEEDGLPGVEANVWALVVRRHGQEDDGRNERDVGKRSGTVVRETGWS